MSLRLATSLFLMVLLCAVTAEAQRKVTLAWNAAPDTPVTVDGYFVYQDGAKISRLLPRTQLGFRVTIRAAVHVFAVTSFSSAAGESDPDLASLVYFSDFWLPPVALMGNPCTPDSSGTPHA
jgi:hypothetical protein